MHKILFPELASRRWGQLNLNAEAVRDWPAKGHTRSPYLNPKFCQSWIADLHRKYKFDFSYGGYLEDRSHLWKGSSYLKDALHIGVDFNVRADAAVHAPRTGIVVDSWVDPRKRGGWGGRLVIMQEDGRNLILAHLLPDLPPEGSLVRAGDIIGRVAEPTNNGGWFPHLHVQVFHDTVIPEDGYGRYESADPLALYTE